ncbi:MAG: helix-turn-helix domain-containing protein [Mycobacteriaceae bacterium]
MRACFPCRRTCPGTRSSGRGSACGAQPSASATARRMKADGHTKRDITKYLGVSRATLYRYLTEDSAV